MTLGKFEMIKTKILGEKFHGPVINPLEYAIRRNEFEQKKLRRVIGLAEPLLGNKTVSRQVDGWKRMLQRTETKGKHLQSMHQDLTANTLTVEQPLTQIRGLGTFRPSSSEKRKGSTS